MRHPDAANAKAVADFIAQQGMAAFQAAVATGELMPPAPLYPLVVRIKHPIHQEAAATVGLAAAHHIERGVRGERELTHGDHFRVGRHLFRFDANSGAGR